MASKKPAAKVAAKKPAAKKVVAPVKKAAPAKKVVIAKKVVPAKKAASAKKVVAKVVVKKPVTKVAPKKVVKPIAKKVVAKAPAKPAAKTVVKPIAKKAVAPKPQPKPVAKKIEVKKVVVKAEPAKAVVKTTLVKEAKPEQAKAIAKAVSVARAQEKAKKVIAKPEIKKPVVLPKFNTKTARKYEPDFTKSVLDKAPVDPGASIVMYSDPDLMEFKELIQRKLGSAKKELAYLQGLITRKDDTGGDDSDGRYMTMEDGSLSMEREQLSQMASRQITFVDHLEKALMRIENKTYGVCRVTGKLIDKARLRAVPHATLSIEAKMSGGK
jgi:RNA polymerase-binding transcription factor DksA